MKLRDEPWINLFLDQVLLQLVQGSDGVHDLRRQLTFFLREWGLFAVHARDVHRGRRVSRYEGALFFGQHLLLPGQAANHEFKVMLRFLVEVQECQAHSYRMMRSFYHRPASDAEIAHMQMEEQHAPKRQRAGSFNVAAGEAYIAEIAPRRRAALL